MWGFRRTPLLDSGKDHCGYQSTFTAAHAVHNATQMERIALITLAQSFSVTITPTLLHMERSSYYRSIGHIYDANLLSGLFIPFQKWYIL